MSLAFAKLNLQTNSMSLTKKISKRMGSNSLSSRYWLCEIVNIATFSQSNAIKNQGVFINHKYKKTLKQKILRWRHQSVGVEDYLSNKNRYGRRTNNRRLTEFSLQLL